jgi:arylformamidase
MQPDPDLHPALLMQREQAYSPSSCIGGNYQPYIAAYGERSVAAHARAQALGGRWIEGRYGALPAQRLDLCLPAAASLNAPCPMLVFIHGGYWQELSAGASLFAAARCIEQGVAFAALDYTLAPHARLGQIVAECRAGWQWLMTSGAAHGIDPHRAVVAGSSAGAHLAASVVLAGQDGPAPSPAPHAAVLVSGIYDLRPLIGTSINAAVGLDETEALQHSPLEGSLHGFAPVLLCWGAIETAAFKCQSARFGDALQAAGTHVQRMEVPQRNHFDVILDLTEPGTELGDATLALIHGR